MGIPVFRHAEAAVAPAVASGLSAVLQTLAEAGQLAESVKRLLA